jgi:hypothetical protein
MPASEREALQTKPPAQRTKQSGRGFLDGTTPLPDKAFTTAMAHKEKLLEFDRTRFEKIYFFYNQECNKKSFCDTQ